MDVRRWTFDVAHPPLIPALALLRATRYTRANGPVMHSKPVIFISAVSGELKGARQLVANTLLFLGYEPDWQDIFGAEQGDLRGMLRRRIDASDGVVQLVGKCYGFEPHGADGVSPLPDAAFGRVSYTQYEALYAKQRGKLVWYLFLDKDFPSDPYDPEPDELRRLQDAYRERVRAAAELHHSASTPDALQLRVHQLRSQLDHLRRGFNRWAAFVAIVLSLVSLGIVWLLIDQRRTNQRITEGFQRLIPSYGLEDTGAARFAQAQEKTVKVEEKLATLNKTMLEALVRIGTATESPPKEDAATRRERAIAEIAKKHGLDPKVLEEKLIAYAQRAQQPPETAEYDRASAAYVAKDYDQAVVLANAAAEKAMQTAPMRTADAIEAYELAGRSAQALGKYDEALAYLKGAGQLTDQTRDPLEWARIRHAIGSLLSEIGRYEEAQVTLQSALAAYLEKSEQANPDALATRSDLAVSLARENKWAEAERQFREVLALQQQVFGEEHPETLSTMNNLAGVMADQNRLPEAEALYRQILLKRTRIFGWEHATTVSTRANLASLFAAQGKYAVAEGEQRLVLALRERDLGAEHPDTLASRSNLARALAAQNKLPEAEAEFRAVLAGMQRFMGAENPAIFQSFQNLAIVLAKQGRYAEAVDLARRAEVGFKGSLGEKSPQTERAKKLREQIESQFKLAKGGNG